MKSVSLFFSLVLAAIVAAGLALAQPPGGSVVTVRAASGALTAGETTTAVGTGFVAPSAVIFLNVTTVTTPDADDVVNFYVQTTYDDSTWVDLANVNLVQADNGSPQKTIIQVGEMISGVAQTDDPTDGTIAADTNADRPLGIKIRIKTTVAGATAPTYAYSCIAVIIP